MSNSLLSLAETLAASASLALIVKVTLLLALAGVVSGFMRARSAAARHYVWALALATSVALPLAALVAPTLELPIVPRSGAVKTVGGGTVQPRADAAVASGGTLTTTTAASANPSDSASVGSLLTRVWLLGFGATLGWLLLGHIGLARLTRTETVLDRDWHDTLESARHDLAIRRNVRLFRSAAVGAPITWGAVRPVIVLPLTAEGWSYERRRVVLLHELAHVGRHDYVMQMIAAVCCALYWFNPAVWLSARRLRYESERACDDQVLACGTASTDYAAHLLSVATGARALRLTGGVAIGMARRSALEGRLLAALDPTAHRAPPSTLARACVTAALGLAVIPLAGMRAVPGTVATPVVTAAAADDSTFQRSVTASPGELLYLDLGPGGDVSIRGWDEARVQVNVRLGGLHWRDLSVDVERERDGVVVRSRFERRRSFQTSNNSYEIRVPRRFDVRLKSGGGDLTIADVEGNFEGTSGGGEMILERLRGRASLSTGGGDIRVDDVNLSGSVSTGGGRVTLSRVSGGLRGSSGSGPVMYGDRSGGRGRAQDDTTADLSAVSVTRGGKRITLGRITRADGVPTLHIDKAGGAVDLEEAPAGAVISTGGGDIRVGRSAGLVEASTGGGDVTIGPAAGSVRAGTGSGTVEVTLIDGRGEEQSVEIQSGSGHVILQLPPNYDGRFEIESAYTQRFGRATRIRSDWDLRRETTDEWDDSQGTPRRYVRGFGSVGRGRGLVYIKTVNGDVTIRRGR